MGVSDISQSLAFADHRCEGWQRARGGYCWTVDLSHFERALDYPGRFNRVVTPATVVAFEDEFRAAIDGTGSFEIAGEVCFWKNHGSPQARNRITRDLLKHLKDPANWNEFALAVKLLSGKPSYGGFEALRRACSQLSGFATPITFLAFYEPTEYPMVDKHIAGWWAANRAMYGYEASPGFSQRDDGWIQATTVARSKQNWEAYLAWRQFCMDYAARIAQYCDLNWRARDVEMAVWEAQENGISLVEL